MKPCSGIISSEESSTSAAVVLGEGADLRVPALIDDLVVDGVALGRPARDVGRAARFSRHPDGAVERHPGLQPAVDEVLAAAAGLPDALVWLVPVLAQPVDEAGDASSQFWWRDLHAVVVGEGHRVHRLAVDVELQLVGGAVADPHRLRAAPPLEVIEDLLGQVGGAVDPVHDLERAARVARMLGGAVAQPVDEPLRLVGEAEAEQRVDGERAVPDPGVPVVPVPLAALLLGQRRRSARRPGAPVGAYVISLSVIAERATISRQRPR